MAQGLTFQVSTARLRLRAPQISDAEAIFGRYASDPEVVRYVGWPRHRTIADTYEFLEFSQAEWGHWSCGPLLIEDRFTGQMLGASGLAFDAPTRASTGCVLARNCWGKGLATEAINAVAALAKERKVTDLYAICHVAHTRSRRVLERCSFSLAEVRAKNVLFPNLGTCEAQDVCYYLRNHLTIIGEDRS
jgi:RimJ/RimL family protein N-acetyltransferase